MNEAQVIVDELRRAFEGEPWHGPSFFAILGRFTPELADRRGMSHHSPWEIALHVGAWIPAVLKRLQGRAIDLGPGEDWPAVDGRNPEAWAAARTAIEADYRDLVSFVGSMRDEAFGAVVPGKSYSARFMLHGLTQHTAYHSGQLAMLAAAAPDPDDARGLLRHSLAVLAYRGGKALRDVPEDFAQFDAGCGTRTPLQVLAHIGDLVEWAVSLADGGHRWSEAEPEGWAGQSARFHAGLAALERRLLDPRPLGCSAERLLQGPIADALTHFGQIALLRRLAGGPIRGENYFKADIKAGVVGPSQPAARLEFD
jgi:hypothetical protein